MRGNRFLSTCNPVVIELFETESDLMSVVSILDQSLRASISLEVLRCTFSFMILCLQATERSKFSKQSTDREAQLKKDFDAQVTSLQHQLKHAQLESSQATSSASNQLVAAQRSVAS